MQLYLPVAEISLDIWPIIFLGLFTGMVSGMFGVGGGVIITPVLLFLHIPPQVAVAAGVSQAAGMSVSGTLSNLYNRRIDFVLTMILILGSIMGLILGSSCLFFLYVSRYLNIFINISYALFLTVMSSLMLWEEIGSTAKKIIPESPLSPQNTTLTKLPDTNSAVNNLSVLSLLVPKSIYLQKSQIWVNNFLLFSIGIVTGFMSVLLGIGGGIILIPMLIYLCQIPLHIAIGTSFVLTCFNASISTIIHANITHSVDVILTFLLCTGSIIGLRLGLYLFDYIKTQYFRLLFLILLLIITVRMFSNLWQAPSSLYLFQDFI